ncbi:putative peptidoglycan binding protein [Gemmobacter caeni]|uniref:Putative peptidoglycan binding protein n=1 Tax=Gemmobacter caeni TaxID=589035 RepID=A0A2T6BBK8_9RHOB|nr:peptidoglycan-binding domain-containing protein [Gemmobacter caeni]PTX53470.1 putative peptidoglycan binding protein [Gemmobacter caeni]TWJ05581.1 putative peptidoglycan binding protein [Gemmobacter caeni]
MKVRTVATTCAVAAAMALSPASPVRADAGDAIAGALIGGIIGHAIAKDQQRRKQTTTTRRSTSTKSTKSTGISAAQREQNREVQTALNHFGYPVGTPDGSLGPKSRSAISSYQATLGYPPTGQLTDYERTLLVTAYHRAVAGGPQVMQVMGTHPMGIKGLLLLQRDEMAGLPTQMPGQMAGQMTGQGMAVAGAMAGAGAMMAAEPVQPVAPAPALPALVAEPAPAPAAPALPSFGGTLVSLSSHCNTIALKTNANGGYMTVANMSDPAQALSEQFCLSRAAAIQQGEALSRAVPGVTPQQVADQCKAFGPVLKDQVTAVSLKPAPEVLAGVTQFIAGSGMSPAQLSGTSKICLGVGYALDDADVALGSALVLTALGESGYAALPGYHLADGIGATRRPDLAMGWFELTPAGAPGLPGTPAGQGDLVRKAVFMLNGRSDGPAQPAAPLPVLAPAPSAPEVVVEAAPAPAETVIAAAPQATSATPPATTPVAARAVSVMTALPRLMLGQ